MNNSYKIVRKNRRNLMEGDILIYEDDFFSDGQKVLAVGIFCGEDSAFDIITCEKVPVVSWWDGSYRVLEVE